MMKVILNILLTMEPTESHPSLLILYDGSSLYSMVRLYCGSEWHGEQSQLSHDNMRDESTYLIYLNFSSKTIEHCKMIVSMLVIRSFSCSNRIITSRISLSHT